ncbi:MAG: hypothetical protein DWI21_05160 [Planctomycetota bacterium]|nr:MAG: hypothetical protein DWI21_05160 [Planctomycetota bacterium]
MTAHQTNPSNDGPSPVIPGFEEIAVHLSQQFSTSTNDVPASQTTSLPTYLDRPTKVPAAPTRLVFRVDAAYPFASPTSTTSNPVLLKLQQMRAAFGRINSRAAIEPLPPREPLRARDRFAGDPRDDVRLQWADNSEPWWHFDIEARMVDRETLWITEKFVEFFLKYLKPVWWNRCVEGINDFLSMIHNELIHPVWAFVTAPIRALAHLIPDIDWPWNFELRGANVSLKQSPFRRIVFDSQLASHVVERLWDDPDEFLAAGQTLTQDDYVAVARVPVKAPTADGHFRNAAVGLLKRFNLRGVTHTLTRLLLFTRGSRSWTYGREMLDAGVGTARPLAMVEDRLGPLRFQSFVLTEQIDGTPLPEFLATTTLNSLELDRLAGQFARIWHTLGELRIVHGAMHASNFVVTPDRQLKLINLDGTWRHWFDLTFLHRRDRDWLRFMKAWRGQPEFGAAFRAAVARHFEEVQVAQRQLSQPLPMQLQRAA